MGVNQSLHAGDRLDIEGTIYLITGSLQVHDAGRATMAWRLVEDHPVLLDRLRGGQVRWLETDEHDEAWLWRPVRTPAGAMLASASLAHAGHTYTQPRRGHYQVAACTGELDGKASVGDQVAYVELHDGERVLLLEEAGGQLHASIGRRVPMPMLARWLADARRRMAMRQSEKSARSLRAKADAESRQQRSTGLVAWATAGVMLLAAALDSCEDECRQRYDTATGRYVEDCDGIRTSGGRGFRGWGGK